MGEKAPPNEKASTEAMATVAEKAPITAERKVRPDLDAKLPKPCNHISLYVVVFFSKYIR